MPHRDGGSILEAGRWGAGRCRTGASLKRKNVVCDGEEIRRPSFFEPEGGGEKDRDGHADCQPEADLALVGIVVMGIVVVEKLHSAQGDGQEGQQDQGCQDTALHEKAGKMGQNRIKTYQMLISTTASVKDIHR